MDKVYIKRLYSHCPHCGGGFTQDITTKPQRSGGVGHVSVECPNCKSVFTVQTA
jgi:ribosomal protein S27AE